ncbi:MAG TPA: MFS transporter [Verrucomicrobiae bacterium]|nr:MFS transporter [Verrucomicrobiae bacterium]
MRAVHRASWRSGDVWIISVSAFFADLGYQAVLAGFPLFLVFTLHQPAWVFGLASALSYGGGAFFSFAGGRLGDRVGHRSLALAGNAVIPLLSLCALVANPVWAIGMLTGGWWARNLRTPSRRVMLVDAVPAEADRSAAFGFLHALDVGGGALAGGYVLVALVAHVPFRWIFLATAIPLIASTLVLSRTHVGGSRPASPRASASDDPMSLPPPGARSLLAAAALYGFTYYSVGFPVLTVAQGSGRLLAGIGAFLVLQATSALTGYALGSRLGAGPAAQFARLGVLGYLGAAVGAGVIAIGSGEHVGLAVTLVGVAVIGFALGIVETLEPAAMSVLRPGARAGRGFGALSASRSVGTFVGNLVMGLLYGVSVPLAYGYAAVVAAIAGVIVLSTLPPLRTWEHTRDRSTCRDGGGGGPNGALPQ